MIVAVAYILWWMISYGDPGYRQSPHYQPKAQPPVNTIKNTTTTINGSAIPIVAEEKTAWGWPGRKAVALIPGERTHPPAACLFGKNEEGDFSSEGGQEPEFLTSIEANYWHNKMNHTADEVIEITAKRTKYFQTGLLK